MNALLNITMRLPDSTVAQARLVLPFELRQKSRLLARLDSGEEVGLLLYRGTILRVGDCLLCSDGRAVAVVAAHESVSVVTSADPWKLARVAYHLGNRHVAVQIGQGWLRYLHDHVLDDMVRGLGFPVRVSQLPFEPEGGAYAHGVATPGTAPAHDHHHDAAHGHDH